MQPRITVVAAAALLIAAGALSTPAARADDATVAQNRIDAAAHVVHEMKQDTHLARLIDDAQGVFIVPKFGKGGFIVGGQGGAGVVLVKHDGEWTDPAFYNIAGGSVGLQAGGSGGAVAMLLMTPRAVHQFRDTAHRWTLSGNAGLTIATYTGNEGAHTGPREDVIVWSNARGLYGGLTAGVTHISPDARIDHAYYHGDVGSREILTGQAQNRHANRLLDALGTRVASK